MYVCIYVYADILVCKCICMYMSTCQYDIPYKFVYNTHQWHKQKPSHTSTQRTKTTSAHKTRLTSIMSICSSSPPSLCRYLTNSNWPQTQATCRQEVPFCVCRRFRHTPDAQYKWSCSYIVAQSPYIEVCMRLEGSSLTHKCISICWWTITNCNSLCIEIKYLITKWLGERMHHM